MGRQESIIKISGQVGGVSFYKNRTGGYFARQSSGISGERVKNDPAFARTRENGAEFGRAGKAGKLLRSALRELLVRTADAGAANRLTREMMRVILADSTSLRGQRNVVDGEIELLTGFEFNVNSNLGSTLLVPFTTTIDRALGTLRVDLPEYVPANMIAAPPGATHFMLISSGLEVDFEQSVFVATTQKTEQLSLLPQALPASALTLALPPASTKPLFLVLGIEFSQFVNGALYPLSNGAYNALALVKVDGGV